MSTAVADLFVILDSVTDPFSKGLKKAASDAESESKRMSGALKAVSTVGLGLAATAVGIGVTSVDMGAKFQSAMTRLSTQAGVAKDQLGYLSNGVLNLAGQVGMSPDSLAEALYHVESNAESMGITSSQALDIVKTAAEGAAVGGANLVDVTNAMTAAVASGIPGVQDMQQAMGTLNAIVGAGDMSMQDLADAFGTGLLASVKGFGVTLADVGAGLATFGDNNIRGALAGNEFRMAVQALAKPVAGAGDALKKLGLTQTTLADDMQRGGLKLALTDLVDRMNIAGVKADQQGQIITDAFGRKAGTGVDILIGQFERTMSKYPKLTEGAHGFGDAWAQTKKTIGQQFNDIRAGADALAIRLGDALIPQLSKLITEGQDALGQIESGFTGASLKAPKVDYKNSRLNQDQLSSSLAQPQTAFERFGQSVHTALGDLETFGQRLEPIGRNFAIFGEDVWQAGEKIVQAVTPTVELIGKGLFLALEGAGKAAANILGPAIKDFANFLEAHQGMVKYFSEVILGGMILKMTILGGINAATGIVNLATSIVQFPTSQLGDISKGLEGLRTAYAGKDAQDSENAIVGLKGAITGLKGTVSSVADKFPILDGLRLKLMGVKDEATNASTAASEAGTVGLPALANGATKAETAATEAEGATTGLAGSLGKFALVGGVVGAAVIGLGYLTTKLAALPSPAQQAAKALQDAATATQKAASGTVQAVTQSATSIASLMESMKMGTATDTMRSSLQGVDQQLAQLVSSGHADQAKRLVTDVDTALQKSGFDSKIAAQDLPQYEKALKGVGDAAQSTDGKLQGMSNTLASTQALTQFNSDLVNAQQQLKSTGNDMSNATTNGIQNQQMFESLAGDVLNYYQQQRTAGTDTNTATNTMLQQKQTIESLGQKFGISKGVVDQFLGSLSQIKPLYSTTVTANTAPAVNALGQLQGMLDAALSAMNSIGTTATVDASNFAHQLNHLPHKASGGPVEAGRPEIVTFGASGYVTPNSMLQPAALAGTRGSGSGGATVVNYNSYTVNVAGTVTTERKLVDVIRTEVLKQDGRNSGNLWSLPR